MTRYSVQPRDQVFVKCYGFLFLLNIWAKKCKSKIRRLSSKYS